MKPAQMPESPTRASGTGAVAPTLEVADHRNARGVRAPDGEGDAQAPAFGRQVRAQTLVDPRVGPLGEQMKVDVAETGHRRMVTAFGAAVAAPLLTRVPRRPYCRMRWINAGRVAWLGDRGGLGLSRCAADHATEMKAREDFAAGRYDEALELFAKLYAETLNAVYLRNIGRCHQKLRHPDKAIDAFKDYLAKGKKIPRRARRDQRLHQRHGGAARRQAAAAARATRRDRHAPPAKPPPVRPLPPAGG